MKVIEFGATAEFSPIAIKNFVLHNSPYFKMINFNIGAGQLFPVHSHDIEGQLSMIVMEGEGEFLGNDSATPAKKGDILISDISVPHGVRAITNMRIIVTIAPPI